MGPLSGQNAPIIIGGVLLGAVVLLWLRAKGSQQVVSNMPALTLFPSTQADQSSVANLLQSVNAIGTRQQSAITTAPTSQSGGGSGVTTSNPNPTTPSFHGSLLEWLQSIGVGATHNIPVGGSGNGHLGGAGNHTGSGNPMSQPLGSGQSPEAIGTINPGFVGSQFSYDAIMRQGGNAYNAAAGAYSSVGSTSGVSPGLLAIPIGPFQGNMMYQAANPNNPADIAFVANNLLGGDYARAEYAIRTVGMPNLASPGNVAGITQFNPSNAPFDEHGNTVYTSPAYTAQLAHGGST